MPSRSLLIGCVHVGQVACLGGSGVVIGAVLPTYYHLDTTMPSAYQDSRRLMNNGECRGANPRPATVVLSESGDVGGVQRGNVPPAGVWGNPQKDTFTVGGWVKSANTFPLPGQSLA